MELVLLIFIALLVLYVVYLQFQLSTTRPPTVVVMPNTTEQESGIGCGAIVLAILLGMIVLAMLGLLPAFG